MFKVGDYVKYSDKFCSPGEEYFIHVVKEVNPDTGKCLIATLNSCLTLGSSEMVDFDMIIPAKKYEIVWDHNGYGGKYLITDTSEKTFFVGYDPMGSVDWTDDENQAFHMDKDDDPWQVVADLESAEI